MTPIHLTAILTAPLLFPALHPVAVWLGLGSVAVLAWVWWRADEALGDCEGAIRAMEAGDVLARMSERRWV